MSMPSPSSRGDSQLPSSISPDGAAQAMMSMIQSHFVGLALGQCLGANFVATTGSPASVHLAHRLRAGYPEQPLGVSADVIDSSERQPGRARLIKSRKEVPPCESD